MPLIRAGGRREGKLKTTTESEKCNWFELASQRWCVLTLGIIMPEVSFPAWTVRAVIQEVIARGIFPDPTGCISRDCVRRWGFQWGLQYIRFPSEDCHGRVSTRECVDLLLKTNCRQGCFSMDNDIWTRFLKDTSLHILWPMPHPFILALALWSFCLVLSFCPSSVLHGLSERYNFLFLFLTTFLSPPLCFLDTFLCQIVRDFLNSQFLCKL